MLDEPATGQGLLGFFLRGVSAGAITEAEALELTGLSADELRDGSIMSILRRRGIATGDIADRAGERDALGAARLHRPLGPRDRGHHVDRQFAAVQLARPKSAPGQHRRARTRGARDDLAAAQRRLLLRREDAARRRAGAASAALVQVAGVHDVADAASRCCSSSTISSDRAILADPSVASVESRGGGRGGRRRDRRRMAALRVDAAARRAARAGRRAGGLARRARRDRHRADAAALGPRGVPARRRDARHDHGGQRRADDRAVAARARRVGAADAAPTRRSRRAPSASRFTTTTSRSRSSR